MLSAKIAFFKMRTALAVLVGLGACSSSVVCGSVTAAPTSAMHATATRLASVQHTAVTQKLAEPSKPLSVAELGKVAEAQSKDMMNLDSAGQLESAKGIKVDSARDLERAAAQETGEMVRLDGQGEVQGAAKAVIDTGAVKKAEAAQAKVAKEVSTTEIKAKQAIDPAKLFKEAMASEHKEESAMTEFRMGKPLSHESEMDALRKREAAHTSASNGDVKGRAQLQKKLSEHLKELAVDHDGKTLPADIKKLLKQALGSQKDDERSMEIPMQRGRAGQMSREAGTEKLASASGLAVDRDNGKVPQAVLAEAEKLAAARGDSDVSHEFAHADHKGTPDTGILGHSAKEGELAENKDAGKSAAKGLLTPAKGALVGQLTGSVVVDSTTTQANTVRVGQQTLKAEGPGLPRGKGLLKLAREAMRSQDSDMKKAKDLAFREEKQVAHAEQLGV